MKEEVERYIHNIVDDDVEPHFERCRIDQWRMLLIMVVKLLA